MASREEEEIEIMAGRYGMAILAQSLDYKSGD
jgi:hypothetical protein